MIDLKGRNALITGSSRGVGQQIALGLAQLGCNIIVHGRNKENCTSTLALLEKYPIRTYMVYGELSEKKFVDDVINQVQSLNIDIDILYNNAAVMPAYHESIWTCTWDEWIDTYKVNVLAMFELCGAFVPAMIERSFGRVVNLTSRIMHKPELAAYGASKWAVDKLTDDIASKLYNTGVRINMIDPGWLRTDMGGAEAEHSVEKSLPGILAPALVDDDGPNGQFFSAIDHDLDIILE